MSSRRITASNLKHPPVRVPWSPRSGLMPQLFICSSLCLDGSPLASMCDITLGESSSCWRIKYRRRHCYAQWCGHSVWQAASRSPLRNLTCVAWWRRCNRWACLALYTRHLGLWRMYGAAETQEPRQTATSLPVFEFEVIWCYLCRTAHGRDMRKNFHCGQDTQFTPDQWHRFSLSDIRHFPPSSHSLELVT